MCDMCALLKGAGVGVESLDYVIVALNGSSLSERVKHH